MFTTLLLALGLMCEPQLIQDLPVDLPSGRIHLRDRRPLLQTKHCPIEFNRDYLFRNGRYVSDYFQKHSLEVKNEKGVGDVFEVYLPDYGYVKFVKDSNYTYKPFFGQEFAFIEGSGSSVNHPDNIEVTSAGKFIILTYLDGKKLVYRKWINKNKVIYNALHYRFGLDRTYLLDQEYERGRTLIKYEYDNFGRLIKGVRYSAKNKKLCEGIVEYHDGSDHRCVLIKANQNLYRCYLEKKGDCLHFDGVFINKELVEECKFIGKKKRNIEVIEDHFHGYGKFDYENSNKERVRSYRNGVKDTGYFYTFVYDPGEIKVLSNHVTTVYKFDQYNRLVEVQAGKRRVKYTLGKFGQIEKKEFFENEQPTYSKEYSFDSRHNITCLKEIIGNEEKVTTYVYDDLCRKIEEVSANGEIARYHYLEDTHLIQKEDFNNRSIEYEYDDAFRLVKRVERDGSLVCRIKRYEYKNRDFECDQPVLESDSYIDLKTKQEVALGKYLYKYEGRKKIQTSKLNEKDECIGTEVFKYDGLKRLIYKKTFCGDEEFYQYDQYSRIISKRIGEYTERYSYGLYNQITGIEYFQKDKLYATETRELDRYGNIKVKDNSILGKRKLKSNSQEKRIVPQAVNEEDKTYDGSLLIEKQCPEGLKFIYSYDGAGRLVREEGAHVGIYRYDCFGNMTYKKVNQLECHYEYDCMGRVIFKSCGAKKVKFEYDCMGNVVSKKIGESYPLKYEYDPFGQVTLSIDAHGQKTIYSYLPNQKITIFPQGNKQVEKFNDSGDLLARRVFRSSGSLLSEEKSQYDENGRVATQEFIDWSYEKVRKRISYTYDNNGRVTFEIINDDFGVYKTEFVYNEKHLVKKIKPDGTALFYDYDEHGRCTEVSSSDSTVHFKIEYDQLDRIVSVDDYTSDSHIYRKYDTSGNVVSERFGDFEIAFEYKHGVRKKCLLPDRTFIEYQYFRNGEILSVDRYDADGAYQYSHDYKYNTSGNVIEKSHPLEIFTSKIEYSPAGRAALTTSPFYKQALTFNGGNVESYLEKKREVHFKYDQVGQITQEGNREYKFLSPGKRRGASVKLDQCGRVVFDGRYYYKYNALDQIIEILSIDGRFKERYCYDYFGRLRSSHRNKRRDYLYDGDTEIGSIVDGKIHVLSVINPKTKERVCVERKEGRFTPIYDLFGNISGLVDLDRRALVEEYESSVFGEDGANKKYLNPWRYKSHRVLGFGGLSIFPKRVYHFASSMFMTRDEEKQAFCFSPYHLCFHNPINYYDEDGQAAESYDITSRGGNFLPPQIHQRLKRAFSFATPKKIYYVNGLSTTKEYLMNTSGFMSQFINQKIIPYYRTCRDSVFGVIKEFFGSRQKARELAFQISQDLEKDKDDIYLFGHSAGGATINKMLTMLTNEERQRLNIVTFGSASIVNPSRVKSATNYYSTKDFLLSTLQSIVHPIDSKRFITFIPSLEPDVIMDHSIMDKTYRERWATELFDIQYSQ